MTSPVDVSTAEPGPAWPQRESCGIDARRILAARRAAAITTVKCTLTCRARHLQRPSIFTPSNVTGGPALEICNGFSRSELPLGMQIIGRPFDEATVLRVGHAYEQATAWRMLGRGSRPVRSSRRSLLRATNRMPAPSMRQPADLPSSSPRARVSN